ncbi:MAG: sodium:proton antiporter, partial [Prevotella sp.]|nr:sodium:proton antiporter [Prevotella sp.]
MTFVIVGILLLAYLLIATENVTNVNRAAVVIFACTLGWVLYIGYGSDFVMNQHSQEYFTFLQGSATSSVRVKEFIANQLLLKYVGRASEIVLFLLATHTIVEILDNNECFEFIRQMLRTRSSQKMLWLLGIVTLVISA